MNIILLGPPGAGKGTQAKLISKEFSLAHLSAGDILRKAIRLGTEAGVQAETYVTKGRLVPDKVILDLITEELTTLKSDYILDGFPRTLLQAKDLDTIADIVAVLSIELDFSILLHRLTGRRSCPSCGAVFHIEFNKPKLSNICDMCGTGLKIRSDDTEETVKDRIQTYVSMTEPLINYYDCQNKLHRFDGNRSINEIFADIKRELLQIIPSD
jgi:adenylate kinase